VTNYDVERPMSLEEQLAMEGVGWDGDLDEIRADRFPDWEFGPDVDTSG